MPEDRRLHVCLGSECNNNCLFCMEEERGKRRNKLGRVDTQTVIAMLSSQQQRDEVMFTAGEPTLRPDLPLLIRKSKELGYRRIGMISNGRRFAYASYLNELLDAGLQFLIVSIHGPDAATHDGLTRTPGSFQNVALGLANIKAARDGGRKLRFSTSTVLNKRNLGNLAAHLEFLATFQPDEVVLNAIQPQGRGGRYFKQLVPTYTQMVEAVAEVVETSQRLGLELRLLDIPPCVTRSLPPSTVGFVESHSHYEPDDEEGTIESVPLWRNQAPELQTEGSAGFAMVTKEIVDEFLRGYAPQCARCQAKNQCEGIWRAYSNAYGFAEFVPFETGTRG